MYRSLLVTFISLHLLSATASAASTPETDEAKFVRLTRQLELAPLQDTDKSMRTWLLEWATESQDVTVSVCDILGPIPAQDVPHGSELLTQMLFGNAAFQISHPEKKSDLVAVQLAGVRSAMAAYASVIAKDPEARIPYFDDLLQKEQVGTLEAFMAPVIASKCSDQDGA